MDKDEFTRRVLTFTALEAIQGYYEYLRTLNKEAALPAFQHLLDVAEQAFTPLMEYARLQYEEATEEEYSE